jgi:hypothetical protein
LPGQEKREERHTVSQNEEFDSITVAELRRQGSVKWSAFPDALGAFIAEMDFGTAPQVLDAVRSAVDVGRFGYLPDHLAEKTAEACAGWQARRYGWTVDPARVHPVADVLRASRSSSGISPRQAARWSCRHRPTCRSCSFLT